MPNQASENPTPLCSLCAKKDRICRDPEGSGPEFCPTLNLDEVIKKTVVEYQKPEVAQFARMASLQEAECYAHRDVKPYVLHPTKPRAQEICEFAQKMGYQRIGLAFCAGLHPEAKIFTQILKAQGFEVVSAVCKVGAVPKEKLGLNKDEQVRTGGFESMCNPIAQAFLLNEAGTDFNVLIGLCVGHDSLFFKYSKAMTTVLVAKDRVTGHNPAAALYTTKTYYARLLRPGIEPEGED